MPADEGSLQYIVTPPQTFLAIAVKGYHPNDQLAFPE